MTLRGLLLKKHNCPIRLIEVEQAQAPMKRSYHIRFPRLGHKPRLSKAWIKLGSPALAGLTCARFHYHKLNLKLGSFHL